MHGLQVLEFMQCTDLKPLRDCGQEHSHQFLKQGHLKPWPNSQAVEAAVAAAIQRERMEFSASLARVNHNIGMSNGSLNPGDPVHLRPPIASAPGFCGSPALPAEASAFTSFCEREQ